MNAYWRNREEQNQREYLLEEDEYVDRLQDILDYTLDQITKEINGFYTRYATKEGITYAEATQRVSKLDMDEYERKAKKYVSERDFSDKANEEMRLYNLTMKVNRLELLKSNIGLDLVDNFMVIDDEMKGYLTERARAEYTRQAGILGISVKNNAQKAEALVNASFRHATFSDRIWMYQAQLKSEIDVLLREGLIQGEGPLELARHLDKLFDTGKYNCERLMRTELCRVQSEAQLDSFIANGFDEYQFNALGDACKDCRALDEQHFKITDAMPGENLPPIHPNCRCAVSAWMDDALYNEWLNSYQNHGMAYADWLANRPEKIYPEVLDINDIEKYDQDFFNDLRGQGIAYNPPEKMQTPLTEEEIIAKLGGEDSTGGSCASQALAYVGNKAGWDVTDYRGGASQEYFSAHYTNRGIATLADVDGDLLVTNDVFTDLLENLIPYRDEGEYILAFGGHEAIIKIDSNKQVKYLELQGTSSENGWHDFGITEMVYRFNSGPAGRVTEICMISVDKLMNYPSFGEILGYINTK